LLLPNEDRDAHVNIKFSYFRQEDFSDPIFKVGMVFETIVSRIATRVP
jgi:hypothetical protein